MSTPTPPAFNSLPLYEHTSSAPSLSRWQRYKAYQYFSDPQLNETPRCKDIVKALWLDWLIVAVITASVFLGDRLIRPSREALFPLQDVSLSFPSKRLPIPTYADAGYMIGIPIVIYFLLSVLWIRSPWDWINVMKGHSYALASSTLVQLILKKTLGRLRPNFYAHCRPSPKLIREFVYKAPELWASTKAIQLYDHRICTGISDNPDHLSSKAFESFPSGHTTAAFAAAVYMALFLNAKMKLWSHNAQHMGGLKMLVVTAPLILAALVAKFMFNAGWHHAEDIIAGAIIGTLFAAAAYKIVYASVFDDRTNHIPLVKPAWDLLEDVPRGVHV